MSNHECTCPGHINVNVPGHSRRYCQGCVNRLRSDLKDTHHNMTLYAEERNEERARADRAEAEVGRLREVIRSVARLDRVSSKGDDK